MSLINKILNNSGVDEVTTRIEDSLEDGEKVLYRTNTSFSISINNSGNAPFIVTDSRLILHIKNDKLYTIKIADIKKVVIKKALFTMNVLVESKYGKINLKLAPLSAYRLWLITKRLNHSASFDMSDLSSERKKKKPIFELNLQKNMQTSRNVSNSMGLIKELEKRLTSGEITTTQFELEKKMLLSRK